MTIHWLRDGLIIIGGLYAFVFGWFAISWFNSRRPAIRTPREQFLADLVERQHISTHKRAA